MSMAIRCDCGQTVRGEDGASLLAAARRHIGERHPDLAGRLSDEDLLRMAGAGDDEG